MKKIILLISFFGLSMSLMAQNIKTLSQKEMDRTRTVYTEITINAAPEVVRALFLDFEKWPEWNPVIPQIAVISGNINDLSTEPTINLTLDFSRKNDPEKAPVTPEVTVNNELSFVWGIYNGFLITAEHVFIFEPINDGAGTHLIHYEKMNGIMSPFFITKKVSANMFDHYVLMNEALKKLCEESL
jgi:cellobiose-specific phosphotransferase system component IIB